MRLTILGKYGPFPKEGAACSSYLLQHDGKNILIDCGSGCLSRLQKFIQLKDIHIILLSHLHFDHIADMTILRYALEALRARGTQMALPVPVYMPDAPQMQAEMLSQGSVFGIQTIDNSTQIQIDDLKITFQQMTHPVKTFAMRFEGGGKAFVYSGDTNMNDQIIPFAKNADVLLMEAGLLSKDKKDNSAPHVSAKEAGLIARQAGAAHLYATHLFPYYEEDEVMQELAQEYNTAQIAQEMQTIEL